MSDTAYKVKAELNKEVKADYTFISLKEALMFQIGMKKKGYDTNLSRIDLNTYAEDKNTL